ncbi:unnamed protein product [Owenia fusiformis]|uniref:Uncharacterized protein n=1 Tax=Owenia fusiformis TaxID=6347 RepID=A0A8S4PHQ1_OWEFU|nr:unnamed protein product [Owenia fusiformis]
MSSGSYFRRIADGDTSGFPSIRSRGSALDNEINGDRHVRFGSAPALHRARAESPTIYRNGNRPDSPSSSRRLSEMQDQMRMFKEELSKKDALITQLSSVNTSINTGLNGSRGIDALKAEALLNVDRHVADSARSEVATLHVKVEHLQKQLRDAASELDNKDSEIRSLRNENSDLREGDVRNKTLIQTLQDRLAAVEAAAGNLEGASNRSEITITSLQRENNEAKERILELEGRVRTHLEEREIAEQDRNTWEKKYSDLVASFSSVLRVDEITGFVPASPDTMVSKLSEIVQENAILKGKMVTLQEALQNTELETKASRETIMRLVSEVGREQKTYKHINSDVTNMRVELDNALASRIDLEREIEALNERLEASQRAWRNARDQLEHRDLNMSTLDREIKEKDYRARDAFTQLTSLKESLVSILGDRYGHGHGAPCEDVIKDRIRSLVTSARDKDANIDMLEQKVRNLTEQLERQIEMQRSAERKIRHAQNDAADMEDRLHHAENDIAATDALKDGLRTDKHRYLKFMERVASAMKVDTISADVGFDMSGDAIIARAEQLQRMEMDALADKTTHVYNLQRKIKSFKDQLESKDLHNDLLRKKIQQLEERVMGRSELEREKDDESLRSRKLEKLVEKYKMQINEHRQEIRDLKARLMDSSNYRIETLEASKEIETLEEKVLRLERVRQKQAKKIHNLKQDIDMVEGEKVGTSQTADYTIGQLSSELATTKAALDEITKRERQLLDMRSVIARMLGLEVNSLAVPDYEIISRLEKLVLANKTHAFTTLTLDSALEDMEDGFKSGYVEATRTLGTRSRSPSPHRSRTRTRSMSPTRRRDPRQY